ncbi:MAG TPA: hypothetical protein PKV44_02920 [Bacillota bacterium]|nr:hypothetical protein [Bacillota bacterium]
MKRNNTFWRKIRITIRRFFRSRSNQSNDGIEPSTFREPYGEYGKAEDLESVWALDKQETYVVEEREKRWPRYVIALITFVALVAIVFGVLPVVLPKFFAQSDIALFVEEEPELIYSDSYRVISKYATNVMTEDDVKSERITQVLLGEPVVFLDDDCENGYIHIVTQDNIEGYVLEEDVCADMTAIEPDMHLYKLVVADTSKRVMSHASNGTLITEVMMNTVLYADVKRDGVYQVMLPGGELGWIGSSGVIELGVNENTEEVSVRYFVSSTLSFVNATHLEGGLSKRGLSVQGLVYVSAGVNGIVLPRTMAGQMNEGTEVELRYDDVTGELLLDSIIPGDLVFFSSSNNPDSDEPEEMAICTDTGVLLMISKSRTTIQLKTFDAKSDLVERIITVRRVFS